MLARATRSALVSMAGAAERAVVDTVVVGAIGAKPRADEASIIVLRATKVVCAPRRKAVSAPTGKGAGSRAGGCALCEL